MTTAAIREKLFDYIRIADDKKLKAIYMILEDDISEKVIRIKRISMPNNGEKWKIMVDNKTVFVLFARFRAFIRIGKSGSSGYN
jgi:hypothetical protein